MVVGELCDESVKFTPFRNIDNHTETEKKENSSSCGLTKRKWIIILCLIPIITAGMIQVVKRNRDWATEEQLYRSALAVCPTSIKALTNYAALNINSNDSRTALAAALRSQALYSQFASSSTAGSLTIKEGQWIKGIWRLENAVRWNNKDPNSRSMLTSALIQWSDKLPTKLADIMRTRAISLGNEATVEGIATASLFHSIGSLALDRGDYDAAIALFKKALNMSQRSAIYKTSQLKFEDTVEDSFILNQLGNAYAAMGMSTDALDAFEQAIKENPHSIAPYSNAGSLLRILGRLSDAIELMEKSLPLLQQASSHDKAALLNNIGLAYGDSGRLDDAIRCFRQAADELGCINFPALKSATASSAEGEPLSSIASYCRLIENNSIRWSSVDWYELGG